MASAKKRNKKKGGRKLEFAIYIAGVLLVCLVVLGIVKGIRALTSGRGGEEPSSAVSQVLAESQESVAAGTSGAASHSSQPTTSTEPSSTASAGAEPSWSVASQTVTSSGKSTNRLPNGDYVNYTVTGVQELNQWYLLLVNPTDTLDSNWKTDMTYLDSEYQLDSRIIGAYRDMVAAASADGVSIYPVSCYRSYSTQTRLYNNRVDRAKRENPSFTQAQAEAYAATHVARPGTSEHQTGLAIDFNSVETDFGSTKAGQWLKKHAEDYGFILRYEKDKQNLTGVTWEPWHYRFVGVKHAKRINQLGYCLEEYVTYLQNGGQ